MRVHIPVVTNAGVDFRLSAHCGSQDRVRVVIDTAVNNWVAALFQAAAAAARAFDLPAGAL